MGIRENKWGSGKQQCSPQSLTPCPPPNSAPACRSRGLMTARRGDRPDSQHTEKRCEMLGTQRRDAGCWARRGDGSSASFRKIFPTVLVCYSYLSKISRVGAINNRNRGCESEIKVLAKLLSPEASLPGLQTAVFSQLSSYCLPSVCLCPNLLFL